VLCVGGVLVALRNLMLKVAFEVLCRCCDYIINNGCFSRIIVFVLGLLTQALRSLRWV